MGWDTLFWYRDGMGWDGMEYMIREIYGRDWLTTHVYVQTNVTIFTALSCVLKGYQLVALKYISSRLS
jgi:hypothetical protein